MVKYMRINLVRSFNAMPLALCTLPETFTKFEQLKNR